MKGIRLVDADRLASMFEDYAMHAKKIRDAACETESKIRADQAYKTYMDCAWRVRTAPKAKEV